MKKGADVSVPLEVTLKDLYIGKTLQVLHKKQVLCTHCRGTGAKNFDDVETCPVCHGKGVRVITQQLGPGFVQQTQTTCDKCNGKGKIVKSVCPHCRGRKVESGKETIKIQIEPGMEDEHKITFRQQCDEAPETTPGDLHFVIQTQPHPLFVRKGNNLHFKTSITLLEALVGFCKTIQHLDDHPVEISSSGVTIPGQVRKIDGEGMPIHNDPSSFGSLFVEYNVVFPTSLTEEQKNLFREILKK